MNFGVREILLLLALLALPIASFLLVFQPQNAAIDSAKNEIEHRRSLLDQLDKELEQAESLRDQNEMLEARIRENEEKLPSGVELDRVIRQVSDLAVKAGLAAPSLKTDKSLDAGKYKEQPLSIESEGTFGGFGNFLLELANLPRSTRVPDLKLERRNTDEPLEIEFTLSIYYSEEG